MDSHWLQGGKFKIKGLCPLVEVRSKICLSGVQTCLCVFGVYFGRKKHLFETSFVGLFGLAKSPPSRFVLVLDFMKYLP